MTSVPKIAPAGNDRDETADPYGTPTQTTPTVLGLVRSRLFGPTSPVWIFLVLLAMIAVFGALKPAEFLGSFDIKSIFTNASVVMCLAVGMTFVIVTAGIDLSVGSVLVLAGVLAAKSMTAIGGANPDSFGTLTIVAGLGVGILAGIACGVVNGTLIARLRIPPLIVTLGMFGIALGLADVLTSGVDLSTVPTSLGAGLGNGQLGPIPWLVVIAVVVTVVGGVVLSQTRFGRHTYAIGSNDEAALRAGINVRWHLIKVYAIAGGLAGVGGDLSLAHFTTTTISGHLEDNLIAISAVVIGGTSLFGGSGTMIGTVVGVFIPVVLAAGLVIMNVQSFWQQVVTGVILIVAVYFDQLRRRARNRL
jgi:ribose transport system permease protein